MKTGLLLCLLIVLAMASCRRERLLEFTEGVVLNVHTNILKSPLTITFVNGNPNSSIVPNNITIDILGEGADYIYTLAGERDITVVDGMVNIGVKDADAPTPDNPIEFTMAANAPGFLPSVYQFTIYDINTTQFATVVLMPESDLPGGVTIDREIAEVPASGFSEPIELETPLINDKLESIKVHVEQGTKLFNANGSKLTGSVELKVVHFDNQSPFSLEAVAGMTDALPARDMDGNDLGNISFEMAGMYYLSMRTAAKEAKTFSKPVTIEMTINEDTYNPLTGAIVQPGDQMPVWSFNETDMVWEMETYANVFEEDGKLQVQYEQDHMSYWLLGGEYDVCPGGTTLQIKTNISPDACERYFFVQVINIATQQPIASRWSNNYLLMGDGTQIQLRQMPEGIMAKLRVWEGVRGCSGELLAESQPFDPCGGGTVNINFSELRDDDWYPISLAISGYCESAGPDLLVRPSGNVLFRPSGCGNYGFLGRGTNGSGCSATLEPGGTYDFKARYGGQVFEFRDIVIEDQEFVYTLASGEQVTIQVSGGANSAELNLEQIPIPEDYCHLIEY